MTDIHFYHDAEDRVAAACHFTVKAWRAGRQVVLATPDGAEARRIDQWLWTWEPLAFIPHVAADSPWAAETPVVIGEPGTPWPHRDVLINLDPAIPPDVGTFNMVVEVVGRSEGERLPARERWRRYRAAGHSLTAHGLGSRDR
jgi:DNA polymerase-3 subunit chi